jgi:AmiR/NasT family two-component response regulator
MKIFIVHDGFNTCLALEQAYKAYGYSDVLFTTLFGDATSQAKFASPDLIIYNAHYPLSHLFIHHALYDADLAKRPFIVGLGAFASDPLTNDQKRLEKARAYEYGCDLYVTPPVEPSRLISWANLAMSKQERAAS